MTALTLKREFSSHSLTAPPATRDARPAGPHRPRAAPAGVDRAANSVIRKPAAGTRHPLSRLAHDCYADAKLQELYSDHGSALRAYVTRLLSDPHLAEDVVQETMMRAWRNAGALDPERGSVAGWLHRVAHNIAVDKVRARWARPDEVEETAATPGSINDHSADVVESVYLARALARLSPPHREVLRLVYFADQTASRASKILGLPVGTVKSRTYHALRRLRACLEEDMAGVDGSLQ